VLGPLVMSSAPLGTPFAVSIVMGAAGAVTLVTVMAAVLVELMVTLSNKLIVAGAARGERKWSRSHRLRSDPEPSDSTTTTCPCWCSDRSDRPPSKPGSFPAEPLRKVWMFPAAMFKAIKLVIGVMLTVPAAVATEYSVTVGPCPPTWPVACSRKWGGKTSHGDGCTDLPPQ